ncbi:MAG: gamma-glutamyltransferase family protein [Alphaproteobacteria bacterium]
MNGFVTRPTIQGSSGVITSTHYVASVIGWEILQRGGNAVDAACAAGFAMQVVEPYLCGPAGEAPILVYRRASRSVAVVNGQGVAPAAATIQRYRALGLDLIPGTGLLAATVPAAFDSWLRALEEFGTLSLEDVLGPAVSLAERGVPMLPMIRQAIESVAETFRNDWPSSARLYLPGGALPPLGRPFSNPEMAATYRRTIDAEREARGKGRAAGFAAARRVFYDGFVAETIDRFCRETEVRDATGRHHRGLLTVEDMARYQGRIEAPVTTDYHGVTVHKCGFWSQGPGFLQQLNVLKGFDLAAMSPNSADLVHTIIESAKLAFADRDAYYGDPDFVAVPADVLLSDEYAVRRRAEIDPRLASLELRAGRILGYTPNMAHLRFAARKGESAQQSRLALAGIGEPATTRLGVPRGDTVHVSVIDKDGNMAAATPSGGWLQSSPVVPGLGFPLGTRAQMFWLIDGHPNSLAPGKRPRTTLTPSLATRDGEPFMAFGSPGGDQQDQWTLHCFLNVVHFGMDLQQAIEAPEYQTTHFPNSFYPREYEPGGLNVEARMPPQTIAELRRRGHRVTVADDWANGRHCAAMIDVETGVMSAAASPRSPYAYAVGR